MEHKAGELEDIVVLRNLAPDTCSWRPGDWLHIHTEEWELVKALSLTSGTSSELADTVRSLQIIPGVFSRSHRSFL